MGMISDNIMFGGSKLKEELAQLDFMEKLFFQEENIIYEQRTQYGKIFSRPYLSAHKQWFCFPCPEDPLQHEWVHLSFPIH